MAKGELKHLLAALMPANRLALEISLNTGLRISDVLNIRATNVAKRFTIIELKTNKKKVVELNVELLEKAKGNAGKYFVFEGRNSQTKKRTRQAVFKDIKRIAKIFRLKINLAPHTMRKVYAVENYKKFGFAKVKQLLNHGSEAVTLLYALADELTAKQLKR